MNAVKYGPRNMYSEQIMEHFQRPRNIGKITNPDYVGESKTGVDGDQVRIYLKLVDEVIVDVKAEVYGCVSAIAATSITTEMLMGKSIDEAKKITREDVARELGGMDAQKIECSNIALDAFRVAIQGIIP